MKRPEDEDVRCECVDAGGEHRPMMYLAKVKSGGSDYYVYECQVCNATKRVLVESLKAKSLR